jgi:hypothetical protein
MEYVDLDEREEQVRVRVRSDRVVQLPAFTGLPLAAGYDEQFRTGTGVAAGSTTSGRSHVRLTRPDTSGSMDEPAARKERAPEARPARETFTAHAQLVNRASDDPGVPREQEPHEPRPRSDASTRSRGK